MPETSEPAALVQRLAGAPAFAIFEPQDLSTLITHCEPRRLAPREALWAAGATGHKAYILVDGALEQTLRHPPQGQTIRQHRQPGTLLGLHHLVQDWEHSSAVTALEQTELLVLTQQRFQDLFEAGEPAAFRLIDRLAEQLVTEMREANERLQDVFGHPAETLRTLRRRLRDG